MKYENLDPESQVTPDDVPTAVREFYTPPDGTARVRFLPKLHGYFTFPGLIHYSKILEKIRGGFTCGRCVGAPCVICEMLQQLIDRARSSPHREVISKWMDDLKPKDVAYYNVILLEDSKVGKVKQPVILRITSQRFLNKLAHRIDNARKGVYLPFWDLWYGAPVDILRRGEGFATDYDVVVPSASSNPVPIVSDEKLFKMFNLEPNPENLEKARAMYKTKLTAMIPNVKERLMDGLPTEEQREQIKALLQSKIGEALQLAGEEKPSASLDDIPAVDTDSTPDWVNEDEAVDDVISDDEMF